MATSYIEHKGYGFWMHDCFLEGVLYLLVKELRAHPLESKWKHTVIQDWTLSYSAGFLGRVPVSLDDHFPDEDKVIFIVTILRSIVRKINTDDRYLTIEELNANSVGGKGHTFLGINKSGFLRTAHMMIDLFEGKIKTQPESSLSYLRFKPRD
ncbi:MAG: hypothetical protein ACOVNZ_07510 [Crocinitomicaceae bacterium]|jgi:hypothetical protein